MFGAEKNSDDLCMLREKLYDVTSFGIHRCLIGQNSKSFSLDQIQVILQKILQARLHLGSCGQ